MPTAVNENPVGERLAGARRAVGLSQRELADRLGMPLWGVQQIETGRADPGPYLSEISSLTGQPMGYFVAPVVQTAVEEEIDADAGEEDTEALVPRRYLVLAALTLLMTIRFFTESLK